MKKHLVIVSLLFLLTRVPLWPQDPAFRPQDPAFRPQDPAFRPQDPAGRLRGKTYTVDHATTIAFTSAAIEVRISDAGGVSTTASVPVAYVVKNGILFIRTAGKLPLPGRIVPPGTYLAVPGADTLLLFSGDGREPVLVAPRDRVRTGGDYFPVSATSALSEGGKTYGPDSLDRLVLGAPWAEGAKGPGVGQALELAPPAAQTVPKAIRLFIVNGFVSFDRPDLFGKNNRIKILEAFEGGTKLADIELADDAGLQAFDLEVSGEEPLRLVVKAVYPGTKFDDTCLTLLYAGITRESIEINLGPDE